MKLSALEIKQQEFEKNFRGYDSNEVKAFLTIVAGEWENMVSHNRSLTQDVKHLKDKLSHFERIQEGMHETLQIAKQSADKEVRAANAEARTRIQKAEHEAENIVNTARAERQEIRQSVLRMLERREEIINSIRSYLELANDSLKKFSSDAKHLHSFEADEKMMQKNEIIHEEEHTSAFPDTENDSDESSNDRPLSESFEDSSATSKVDDIIDKID
jgi:cell division initiation protein